MYTVGHMPTDVATTSAPVPKDNFVLMVIIMAACFVIAVAIVTTTIVCVVAKKKTTKRFEQNYIIRFCSCFIDWQHETLRLWVGFSVTVVTLL